MAFECAGFFLLGKDECRNLHFNESRSRIRYPIYKVFSRDWDVGNDGYTRGAWFEPRRGRSSIPHIYEASEEESKSEDLYWIR
jgi:hypothetical protein